MTRGLSRLVSSDITNTRNECFVEPTNDNNFTILFVHTIVYFIRFLKCMKIYELMCGRRHL